MDNSKNYDALLENGEMETSLVNDLYKDILEWGDIYLALSPASCGAPPKCGKSPNSCNSFCDCSC